MRKKSGGWGGGLVGRAFLRLPTLYSLFPLALTGTPAASHARTAAMTRSLRLWLESSIVPSTSEATKEIGGAERAASGAARWAAGLARRWGAREWEAMVCAWGGGPFL